jgi:hypothetical protein
MVQRSYDVTGPLDVSVKIGSGEVQVQHAEPVGTASVSVLPKDADHEPSVRLAESAQVTLDGDRLSVSVPDHGRVFRRGEVRVELHLPRSSRLAVKAGSCTVHVRDGLATLEAKLGMGDVDVDEVEDVLVVKAGQGDVTVGRAAAVHVTTGQGSLRAEHVGDLAFKTGHGSAALGRTEGEVLVKGGMVKLLVREASSGDVVFDTGSGSATIGVLEGTGVQLDLSSGSGDVRCDLPMESSAPVGGAGLKLKLRTGSGNLRVAPAATAGV